MDQNHPAREHMLAIGRDIPHLWDEMEDRASRCRVAGYYIDHASAADAAGAALSKDWSVERKRGVADWTMSQHAQFTHELATLASWRMGQNIYRFDPEIYAAVSETRGQEGVPVEILSRLPNWCIFIETPGLALKGPAGQKMGISGAWLRIDRIGSRLGMVITVLFEDKRSKVLSSMLPIGENLDAVLSQVIDDAGAVAGAQLRSYLPVILNLATYVCVEHAERVENPDFVKTKRGFRRFPAATPKIHDVGVRLGQAIRAASAARNESGGGKSPRPHMRRAHWHRYWVGPKLGGRKVQVRWMPPVPVGIKGTEDTGAVIRAVK